jgi:hypothetical protein
MIGFYIALFFGGAFFVNALPHFLSGLEGRKFPSPFAKPPGKGESSSIVNVLWGFFNFIVAHVLLCDVVRFDIESIPQFAVVAVGGLLMALLLAMNFGKVYGGSK